MNNAQEAYARLAAFQDTFKTQPPDLGPKKMYAHNPGEPKQYGTRELASLISDLFTIIAQDFEYRQKGAMRSVPYV